MSRWRDPSLWVVLFTAFVVLRLVGTRTPLIVDELIPLRVFDAMDARGVLLAGLVQWRLQRSDGDPRVREPGDGVG
jgi:hypothetical protein